MKALIPQGLIGRPNYFGLLNNLMALIICEILREIGEMARVTSAWSSRGQTLKLSNTWTHTFVCLGRMIDNEVPSTGYKTQLSCTSLGETKMTFEKKSLCGYFHEKLLES